MTKLGSLRFLEKAKELVIDYFNREVEKTDKSSIKSGLDGDVVWYCSLLGNHKCLINQMGCIMRLHTIRIKEKFIWMLIRNGKVNVMYTKVRYESR